jgi:uncharacterized protein DUF1302
MRDAQCGWLARWQWVLVVTLLTLGVGWRTPASATLKYGAFELSGNFETQNLVRHSSIDKAQFIQNRNTVRLRVDWDWLDRGRFIDKYDIPFIERSKFYLLYRGVYDGFYDIAPTDLQHGQTRFDDLVGGPISGNDAGHCVGGPCDGVRPLQRGNYSRLTGGDRSGLKFDNVLREAYVDLKLAGQPVSFRLGRQQVIWGESDQFRLMDIWNPIDVTWHLQQESWDNIRIPLWLGKGLWDIGDIGPFSNTFMEVVYNPFDFQPNQKLDFLPEPWAAFLPNPLRAGQLQQVTGTSYLTPVFDLQGTSFRRGNFSRNPQDASEVGVRLHGVTPQGLELSVNYLYARARPIGASNPLGVKITKIGPRVTPATAGINKPGATWQIQDLNGASCAGTRGCSVSTIPVTAEIKYPYNHIFGLTGNYFEGDYTSTVFRFETAYALGEPVQTVDPEKTLLAGQNYTRFAPLGYDRRDVWAGMLGFDRPTWIRLLNPKATWFLTAQFFWSYYNGNVNFLRGNSGAGETPYFTPADAQDLGHNTQGFVRWTSGPYAGLVERLQPATCRPGAPCLPNGVTTDPSGDRLRRWEHLITFAGTSFYRGGTVVPFIADAFDPVNDSNEALWNIDYFYTNNFIITFQQKFFMTYGSGAPSDDPWGAGGRNARRDETGIKLTYQF